jgi:antitoxin (DNA-binding transcriptional repressor) of toxin-antitoxin stability system
VGYKVEVIRKTLNVREAKTRLSSVLAEISEQGERLLICRNDKTSQISSLTSRRAG